MRDTVTSSTPLSALPVIDSQMRRRGWMALLQVLILFGMALVVISGELPHIYIEFFANPDAAHTWVVPLLMALLIYRWRGPLLRTLSRGSPWGIALILLGLAMFIITSWPLNYGFVRRMSILPMILGAVLAVAGWRVFWICAPLYILSLLAIPTGSRYYAFIIIGPETFTLKYASAMLNLWPGVFVDANGPDLTYIGDNGSGYIALGESNRGVSMLLPMLAIGIFIAFASRRSLWKYAVCLFLLVPIALICNFLRFLILGSFTIITEAEPISGAPRAVAATSCLVLAYGSYALVAWLLGGDDPSAETTTIEVNS